MPRINNKDAYPFDNQLSLDDYVIGSDADNVDVTRNYRLRGVYQTFKSALNLASLEYTFAGGSDPDINHTDAGFFTTNSDTTLFGSITSLLVNKEDLNGIDISSIVDVVSQNTSSFILRLFKPSASDQVFYFAISNITDNTTHYTFTVSDFVGGTAIVDETTYTLSFDLAGVPSIYSETDPVFTASDAASITASQITNWDTAFGWGDHSVEGYLTSSDISSFISLTDLSITTAVAGTAALSYNNLTGVFTYTPPDLSSYITTETDPIFAASAASNVTTVSINQWNTAYGWGDHSVEGYITSETDPVFSASIAAGITLSDTNNWNSAYAWGDHAAVGYLTSADIDTFAELDTIVADKSLVNLEDGGVFSGSVSVPDQAYGVSWNGSSQVPTKNAVYDQMETRLAASSYTAADVLSKLLTVDGSGSGLDADTVDALEASQFVRSDTSDTMSGDYTVLGSVNLGSNTDSTYRQLTVTRKDSTTSDYGTSGIVVDVNSQYGIFYNNVNGSTAGQIRLGGTSNTFEYNDGTASWNILNESTTEANFTNFPSTSNISFNFDNASIVNQGATLRYEYSDTNMLTGGGFGFQILGYAGSVDPSLEVEGLIYSDTELRTAGRVTSEGIDIISSGTAMDVQTGVSQWAIRTDTNNANFSGILFSSAGDGYILGRTSAGNLGIDLRPFETSKLYGNILEVHGQSPRLRLLEKSSGTEADVFGSSTSDWTVLLDGGDFDIRENNTTNTRFRVESGGVVNTYNNLVINSGGDLQFASSGSVLIHSTEQSRDKIRVWSSAPYSIGMGSLYTYGGLNNDFSMTFQMNNDNDRGWWWGDDSHTNAQGAMALTTQGRLTVASYTRIGYGESDTTIPGTTYMLQVNGDVQASDFVLSSDFRMKEDVSTLEPKNIDAKWKKFRFVEDESKAIRHGVIAQELEEVHPEFVVTDEKGMKSVRYVDLLVAKIAELEARIEKLENSK